MVEVQIIHRVSTSSSATIQRELAKLGVIVADHGFVYFDFDEDNDGWPAVSEWIARSGAVDVARTNFSKKELADARFLELVPDWHHGYPQPDEDTFGYQQATYDLADWCEVCGVGKKQKAPFQMKGEPKWGKNSILQLNWVFDEYFVTPELWSRVFAPHGVTSMPVMNTAGSELRTVVQIVIEEEVDIIASGLRFEVCTKCSRKKYLPVARGPFPPLAEEPSQAIARTKQYFGSGGRADKCVLVSQQLARSMTALKVRGASLRPVQPS